MEEVREVLEPKNSESNTPGEDFVERMVKGDFDTERVGASKGYIEKLEGKLEDIPTLETRKVYSNSVSRDTDLRYSQKVNDNAKDKIGGTEPDLLIEGSDYSILVTRGGLLPTNGTVAWIDGLDNIDTLYSGKIEDEEFQRTADLLSNTDIQDYLEQRGYKL